MIHLINRLTPNPPETFEGMALLLDEIVDSKPNKEWLETFIYPVIKNSWIGGAKNNQI